MPKIFSPNEMDCVTSFTKTEILGTVFEATTRYTNIKPVGIGAFGLICSAEDRVTKCCVAIKKVAKPLKSLIIAKRTCRELRLLKFWRNENIICLHDVFISPSEDIYFVTELLRTDLQTLITSGPIEAKYSQYFMYQILRALKYIHSAGVIHRDLKPSNILINENCDLKICDFGLSRDTDIHMTGYVATRYYRAPEVMLNWQMYDVAMDIWSAGCILAEMLTGKVLFPGKDHIDQFVIIRDLLGSPSDEVLDTISSKNTLCFVQSLPKRKPQSLAEKLKLKNKITIDLLEKMLCLDSRKRIIASQGLAHPYCAAYYDAEDEPVAEEKFDWSWNENEMNKNSWRDLMYSEVLYFHDALENERNSEEQLLWSKRT